jgi:multidrug efflux pump subunit AcrB/outer membrane protein TolC
MNIVKVSLNNKQVTLSVLILTFIFGLISLITMPRREDPKINVPQALVITYYPGATSAQVEEQVTRKVEQYLFQYAEVRKNKTYSTSQDGVSIINVSLNEDVKNMDVFWSKLSQKLLIAKNLDLPAGVRGPVVNSGFGETEALLIAIESEKADYSELANYCSMLDDRLRTIHATAQTKRLGEQKEQITVYFNSEKLSQYGLSLQQIVKVLKAQNTVDATGETETGTSNVTLYNSGYYQSQEQIASQIVGTSGTGAVVRLGDIATIKREYADPSSDISVNGHHAIIVAVQMHEGNNIVEYNEKVQQALSEISKQLPSHVKIITIVNQPALVKDNISHFLHEFFLAILSVLIVVVLMLPLRIAAVAAAAIPMTISVTFAILHTFGIELHQVSLSALIVVLGMVVDDAIVVADNYVDLIDKGFDRATAAWRSASDLSIPILTATITIIASFMPMTILTGAVGEFIHDLPITVTIALASSFFVAMLLTPMLCFAFIHKGLHNNTYENTQSKKKFSILEIIQTLYNHTIDWCARHPAVTIIGSIITIVLSIVIFKLAVGQKFFPYAERNQFVVEIWMPTGTKLDKTKETAAEVESLFKGDERITSFALFAGTSAPRVYYNFAPEFPVSNYAQFLINTRNDKATEQLASELESKVGKLIPGGLVQVKLMQQGQPLLAPVEVRIFGEDIPTLQKLGRDVKQILKHTSGSFLVSDDFREDYCGINIELKNEAPRLGFTTEDISQLLYTNTHGAVISTMYEGKNAIDIVMRLDSNKRQSLQNLEDIYLESPATEKCVPLRQIANLSPKWYPGRIMHRNGVRCLTIRSETSHGVLPAQLLASIRPEMMHLQLPEGYRIEFGGEYSNKKEVFTQMIVALGIGLILIFLILMFQFRNLKETFIIMLTIPLSSFGAIAGLAVTGNNFGFTAFVGLVSLSGIVVRNAIILLEHTNELIAKGMSIREAAIEGGKRRLRPIFLTAMAAAIGVFPMILSGSSLWSPLASVIAFGVTWSMLMALLTVPVLFIVIIKDAKTTANHTEQITNPVPAINGDHQGRDAAMVLLIIGLFLVTPNLQAQDTTLNLNLEDITSLALHNNHLLKAKELSVLEKQKKIREDQVKFLPTVTVGAAYQYSQNLPELTIEQGAFGQLPMGTTVVPLPAEDKTMVLSEHKTGVAGIVVYQPLTQLPKINAGVQIAKTEFEIVKTEKTKADMQIKQAAEKLFYSMLITIKQQREALLKCAAANIKLHDGESALNAGKITNPAISGLRAAAADEEQDLLKINIQYEDIMAELKFLTGISDSVTLHIDTTYSGIASIQEYQVDSLFQQAKSGNTDLIIAMLNKKKAILGKKAASLSYLPEICVSGGYLYQNGQSWYPENNAFAGVSLKWNITDNLSTTSIRKQRSYLSMQADENIMNTSNRLYTDISKGVRRLTQSAELVSVAQKALVFRREETSFQIDKYSAGLTTEYDVLATKAALAKAEGDFLAAQLDYRIALSDLQILTGDY